MKDEHTNTETNRGRLLRVGFLSLAIIGPIAANILDFFRKRREFLFAATADTEQRADLNTAVKQLSATGRGLSQGLLKRGGSVVENVTAQGGKITQSVLKRGGQVRHDLGERGSHVRRDLGERGSHVTRAVAERGDHLLQPLRKQGSTFWMIFGFSLGMVAAAVVTFVLLRKRISNQRAGEEEQIELPQEQILNGNSSQEQRQQGKPSGEIRHLDNETGFVATLQTVGVDGAQTVETPANATFVGVASTKHYYPLEKSPGESAQDIVYFISEDEAKAQGYSAAE